MDQIEGREQSVPSQSDGVPRKRMNQGRCNFKYSSKKIAWHARNYEAHDKSASSRQRQTAAMAPNAEDPKSRSRKLDMPFFHLLAQT